MSVLTATQPVLTATQSETLPHDGRYYTAPTYLLPSDDAERARLNRQHEMLKRYSDEMIPSGVMLKDGDSILDAGTGSGVWVLDVAKAVPATVTVTGVDIEKRLFPEPLPNTKFLVQSSLQQPPDWSLTFAFVHQRLMVAGFSHDAWEKCISEFYRVLKPGGYVQLQEIDFVGALHGDRPLPPFSARFQEGAKLLCQARDIAPDDLLKISALLKEAGFEDVKMDQRPIYLGSEGDGQARRAFIGAWRSMKVPFLKAGGMGLARTSDEWDALLDQIDEEWRTTNFARLWVTWTAKKPE